MTPQQIARLAAIAAAEELVRSLKDWRISQDDPRVFGLMVQNWDNVNKIVGALEL